MKKINVLVTGAGGGGIGEQVIKCLRLSNLNLKIITTDVTEVTKAKIDGDEFSLMPSASDSNYISCILNLCTNKKIEVIIPGSEIELKTFSNNRAIFKKAGITLLINGQEIIRICLNKNLTSKFLTENGFLSPVSFAVSGMGELKDINIFPLVLKPSVGGGGSINTLIVQNKYELKVFGKFLLKQYPEFIAQEYVGDARSEFTVGVFSTKGGLIVDSICLRRNILAGLGSKIKLLNTSKKKELGEYLAISSGISQGEIVRNSLLTNVCESVAMKLKSTGPLNIQCRLVGEKVYIFEINPRFSGTSPIRALANFNEVEIAISDHLGIKTQFSRIDYKLGHAVRGLNEYFV